MIQVIDLRSDYIEIVEQILAEYVPDCEVYAFGSRVRGKVKPHSDLDLVVRGHAPYHGSVLAYSRKRLQNQTCRCE